jgi:Flp pilus assembly protein TadG
MGMRTFFRNEDGTGAIEFALIAPLLAIVLLGTMSGWAYYQQNNSMRDSVEVAGKYFLQGGTSADVGLTIAEAAWSGKPDDGTVSLNKTCICDGAAASCSGVCSDSSIPQTYWTIEASSYYTDPFFVDPIFPNGLPLYEREVIRVR